MIFDNGLSTANPSTKINKNTKDKTLKTILRKNCLRIKVASLQCEY